MAISTSTAGCWGCDWCSRGVNADDPEMRHIAYGDERGSPDSLLTFFDMRGVMRGRPGAGMVHRLLFRVAGEGALDFWKRGSLAPPASPVPFCWRSPHPRRRTASRATR